MRAERTSVTPSMLVKACATFLVLSPSGSFANQHSNDAETVLGGLWFALPNVLKPEHCPSRTGNIFIEKPCPPRRDESRQQYREERQQHCSEPFHRADSA